MKKRLMKNGMANHNIVKKGYKGYKGFRYHPTKGYRKESDFVVHQKKTNLENLIIHEEVKK